MRVVSVFVLVPDVRHRHGSLSCVCAGHVGMEMGRMECSGEERNMCLGRSWNLGKDHHARAVVLLKIHVHCVSVGSGWVGVESCGIGRAWPVV